MKLRAAICERDKDKREYLKYGLESLGMDIETVEFRDEYDFKESLGEEASAYDIVVLNTALRKEKDGMELAEYVRRKNRKVMLLFATESEEYYAQAFDVFATGYLLHPVDLRKLQNCISFYYHRTNMERRASWMIKEVGGNYRRIYCRHIVYIESDNRELILHLEDGSELVCYSKLNTAEQELPGELFMRCHQSYLVNLYFVEELASGQITVKGEEVPISRKYQKQVKEVYYNYMFSKM